jgi:hypothetical protein
MEALCHLPHHRAEIGRLELQMAAFKPGLTGVAAPVSRR